MDVLLAMIPLPVKNVSLSFGSPLLSSVPNVLQFFWDAIAVLLRQLVMNVVSDTISQEVFVYLVSLR